MTYLDTHTHTHIHKSTTPQEMLRVLENLAERSQILSMLTPLPAQVPPPTPAGLQGALHHAHPSASQFSSVGGAGSSSGGGGLSGLGGHLRDMSSVSLASLATTTLSSTSGAGIIPAPTAPGSATTPRAGGGASGQPPAPPTQQQQPQAPPPQQQQQQQFGSVSGSDEYHQSYHH